jgi:hypothetical protein
MLPSVFVNNLPSLIRNEYNVYLMGFFYPNLVMEVFVSNESPNEITDLMHWYFSATTVWVAVTAC